MTGHETASAVAFARELVAQGRGGDAGRLARELLVLSDRLAAVAALPERWLLASQGGHISEFDRGVAACYADCSWKLTEALGQDPAR